MNVIGHEPCVVAQRLRVGRQLPHHRQGKDQGLPDRPHGSSQQNRLPGMRVAHSSRGFGLSVLRHHHIPIDVETEAASNALQRSIEPLPACVRREQWTAMIATERNQVGGFLKSFQTPRHEVSLRPATSRSVCRRISQGLRGYFVRLIFP